MGWVQRVVWGLGVAGVVVSAGAGWVLYRALPVLDGTLAVPGLEAPAAVRRDPADVTHIEAASPQDAWFALGFVHAQERSWQLEFNRRLMHGTLSEAFGPATLETDRLMRALDIIGTARRQLAGLPPDAREALERYSAGIVAFHRDRPQTLPPEFHLLGVAPGGAYEPVWTAEDSVGWSLMMALDLGGNWGQEWARLSMLQVLDTQRLWEALPPYPGEPPSTSTDLAALYRTLGVYRAAEPVAPTSGRPVPPLALSEPPGIQPPNTRPGAEFPSPTDWLAEELSSHMQQWARQRATQVGQSGGKGSNNWVVAGSHTVSGKPLLANDPHLGLTAPAIWYTAHLRAPAGRTADGTPIAPIDAIGATLPGLPFVILGRTASVAWGFTNTGPDVQDLYLEQINPENADEYRTPEGWERFTTRRETVHVKGQPDEVLTLRRTRHGPVLSDVQSIHGEVLDLQRHVLALRWSALDADNRTVVAGLRTNQAQSVDELFQALRDYHAPMQSVVAADVHGTVRMQAVGRVPVRHPDNDLRGVAPAPGWLARYDWQGWIPWQDLPRDDGARGWIATANQRITAPDYPHFLTGDWSLPYRHDRITERLEATPRHDRASMQALHADVTSRAAQRLLPLLQGLTPRHPLAQAAQAELADFSGVMVMDRAAPLIFAAWVDELTRGVIGSRVGTRFAQLYGRRDFRAGLETILARDDPWWCGEAGCQAAATRALERALERLQALYGDQVSRWRWGEAHVARSVHRPLGNVPALTHFFDVRVPTPGDGYTVNVGQYNPGDTARPFVNVHAASLRAIYDLADLEQSQFIYQTGQSGVVYSGRYRDMRSTWAQVGYRPLQRDPPRWEHQLSLVPAP